MSEYQINEGNWDGVGSQGTYVFITKDGKAVKQYGVYSPFPKLRARLYILRHRLFG